MKTVNKSYLVESEYGYRIMNVNAASLDEYTFDEAKNLMILDEKIFENAEDMVEYEEDTPIEWC